MKRKMLMGQILMLSVISLVSSSSENLECFTDNLDVITCIWNTSSAEDRFQITPSTKCSLKTKYDDYSETLQTPEINMEPLGSSPKLRKGTLQFLDNSFYYGSPYIWLAVHCQHLNETVKTIPRFHLLGHVKLYPPEKLLVEGKNVTWRPGYPQTTYVRTVKYEVQWGLLENNWTNNQVLFTEEEHCELLEENLILGAKYVVRVRSSPANNVVFWSEWSPVTEWTSTVGSQPLPEDPSDIIVSIFTNLTSLAILVTVAVILLIFFCILPHRRNLKCPYVPTPGKYFGSLFSDHGGDFKSWLGPIVNPEMFIKADSEFISPVTIFKACNCDMLSNKMEKDVSLRDGNTSSFSNSTYFLSQSSKCAAILDQLEPCLADSPYGPAGGGSVQEKILPATHDNSHDNELREVSMSTPLETSSSYKQLQKLRLDIQSPDSGFAGSSGEQESQEESGSEGLPSPPVVHNTLPISCILPCPVPQLIEFPHLGIPPGLALSPWNKQNFTNLPPNISGNVLLGTSGIMPCSGMLEPSSDDYMPVKRI